MTVLHSIRRALVRRFVPGTHPATVQLVAERATLSRSLGLLTSFPLEQSDPDTFYRGLARDTRVLLEDLYCGTVNEDPGAANLSGQTVLDVGGGPGYFRDEFNDVGAWYVAVEPDVRELSAAGLTHTDVVRGSGMELPFATDSVDVCFSSNVAEHVPRPWQLADEMLRVTRPGGLVVLSYTLWYGPFGGHEMGLTHYLGGARAARMYERKHGHRPKNYFGTSLFKVGCADGLRWARSAHAGGQATLLAAFPRYHPWWAWWCTKVPWFREVAVSNLVLVLKKTGGSGD